MKPSCLRSCRLISFFALLSPVLIVPSAFGQTVTISLSTPNPNNYGQTVQINVVTSPPGHLVEVDDITNPSSPVNLGTAQSSIVGGNVVAGTIRPNPPLTPGTHQLRGFAMFVDPPPIYSNTIAQVINPISTSLSLTPSVNPSASNALVTFTATVSPASAQCCTASGTVAFRSDGVQIGGIQNLVGDSASVNVSTLSPGNHTITASYSGDSNFTSSSSQITQTVMPPQNTNTSLSIQSSPNPAPACSSVNFTVSVSPSSASGTVTLSDGVITLGTVPLSGGFAFFSTTSLGPGSHQIQARYNPDTGFNSSSNSATQVVMGSVSASLVSSSNPSNPGQAVTFTTTIAPIQCSSASFPPATGTVQFLDGSTPLGSQSLSFGTASISSTLATGTHNITATYSGDSNYSPATTNTVQQLVQTQSQSTVTTLLVSPTNASLGDPITLTATVSPPTAPGSVTFLDNGVPFASQQLTGGSAVFTTTTLPAGTHNLTAAYNGATNFGTSTSQPPVPVTINSPSNASCSFSLSAGSATVGGGASTGSVQVTAPTGCAFTASSPAGSFVTITSGASGSGNTTVTYSVLANPTSVSRSATLTIAGLPFAINQLIGCVFGLTPSSATFPAGGGSNVVGVGASSQNCGFTAASNSPSFLIVNSGSGLGSSQVGYTVLPNSSSASRTGTLTIAGQTFTVVQAGTTCGFVLTQSAQAFTAAGGSGSATVQAPAGCTWTALSNSAFVTITNGASGSGNGSVTFSVQPNSSAGIRTGTLTIAALPFAVTQSAASSASCIASSPAATQVAIEGRTEVLGDLLLTCTGFGTPFTADLTVALNTNVTNAIINGFSDAALLVNGSATANGIVRGYNTLEWQNVVISPGATLRVTKMRADASLLGAPATLQSIPIVASVNLNASVPVPVANASQTLAFAGPTLVFQKGAVSTTAGGSQTTVALQYQEATVAAFQPAGSASPTRLRMVLSGVPANVQVFVPVFPNEGTRAQLFTADANGAGGSPVTGGPGSLQQLNVSGGVATATWVVLASDPAQFETETFPLVLQNASATDLTQIQVAASLGPVSAVSLASASAPLPRYRDFSTPQSLVNLRTTISGQQGSAASSLTARTLAPRAASAIVGSNATFTSNVVNDNQDTTATGVTVGSNVTGGNVTSCQTTVGTCTMSGNTATVNVGTLEPMRVVTVTVTAVATLCSTDVCTVRDDVTIGSDEPNAQRGGGNASTLVVLNASAPGVPSTVVASGTPQSTRIGTAFPLPLQITVTDGLGLPVANQTVTFSAPTSGASATLSSTTAVTGSSGSATVTATANNTAGTYTISASVAGITSLFSLTNTQTQPANGDLAQGQAASQSSTLPGTPPASAAVDGNTDGRFFSNSVTATNLQANPWWQVDLGASTTIGTVVVWNRTDCCGARLSDYWVFVSNTPFLDSDTPATLASRVGTFASHQTTAPNPSASIAANTQGRYVRVQLSGTDYLSLAEAQVFGSGGGSGAMVASQSSTLAGTPPASAAIDGNTDGNFYNGSVTATNLESNPWWQVDLGASTTVSSVTIWNRTDCCGSRLSDYWVFLSDTPFQDGDTPNSLQFRGATTSSHQTSTPNPSATIPLNARGRYLRIQLNSPNYLSLAEVRVNQGAGGGGDLALGKAATQSSSLPGTPPASAAADGNTDGSFFNGSVTATNLESNPWWQVDLGASASVSSVVVWNRTDCCGSRLNDYWVFVSDTPFAATDTPSTLQFRPGTFASHQTAAPAPSATIPANAQGRYVRIQLSGANYLSLAEVQVFGTGGSAPTKTASQSSTLPGTPAAGAAIDGNTDGNFYHGSVTATNLENTPWWQVDLGTTQTINNVLVWNRTDCCSSRLSTYYVFVSNSPFDPADTPASLLVKPGVSASPLQFAPPSPVTTIPFGVQGRYIRVQLTGADYLSLAEVQVQ